MKLLFYSADSSEMDRASTAFLAAGIPCEVREGSALEGRSREVKQAELWIQNDGDYHRAAMLCVHLGIGFGKRAPRKLRLHDEQRDLPWE